MRIRASESVIAHALMRRHRLYRSITDNARHAKLARKPRKRPFNRNDRG
jgi:hypothetical protein